MGLDLRALSLRGAGVELHVPDEAEVEALGRVAQAGIHPPERTPFAHPWTDLRGDAFLERFRDFHRRARDEWTPALWHLVLAVGARGILVGAQGLRGEWVDGRLAVETGSWLGAPFQGRGYGTIMRAAALELAFAGLGADRATSGAIELNDASARVSERLGYRRTDDTFLAPRGYPVRQRRYLITREEWLGNPDRPATEIVGLDACGRVFGPPG